MQNSPWQGAEQANEEEHRVEAEPELQDAPCKEITPLREPEGNSFFKAY